MYHQQYDYKLLIFDVYIVIGNKSGEKLNIFYWNDDIYKFLLF